jgi:hypothetical protein
MRRNKMETLPIRTITISVPQKEVDEMNAILNKEIPPPNVGESRTYELFKTYTADFGDGWKVKIGIYKGNFSSYVWPMLLKDKKIVNVIDGKNTLEGEYVFYVEETFKVIIEAV